MIARMAKISIAGPKELAQKVLALLRDLNMMQIDPRVRPASPDNASACFRPGILAPRSLAEGLYYEKLLQKIDVVLTLLPPASAANPLLSPRAMARIVAEQVDRHMTACRAAHDRRIALAKERSQLERASDFLDGVAHMLPKQAGSDDLAVIGVFAADLKAVTRLETTTKKITADSYHFSSGQTPSGEYRVVITTGQEITEKLRNTLTAEGFSLYAPPPSLTRHPLSDQGPVAQKRLAALLVEETAITKKLVRAAAQWRGIYMAVRELLASRLAIIQEMASLHETDMCFFLCGWLPADKCSSLEQALLERFKGRVVVEQQEISVHELGNVPTMLKNPAYFEPFELFARLLPTPSYVSFDMTPYLGIFFPIFFGIMIGDMGYGIVLLVTALLLISLGKSRKTLVDAGKILGVSACYTIVFGWLFGEFFGQIGQELFSLRPILFDRHNSILPMLYCALSIGVIHIVCAHILGLVLAVRNRMTKEALFKAGIILVIFLAIAGVASSWHPALQAAKIPLLITTGGLVPVLILVGGFLAPLEVMKSIGNIISYARIMAIGLTSVLLAYVANYLAGTAGSIWVGILIGILLHGFNILLGLFAPTIHALRLHYVEFFSKFMHSGGRAFTPLAKK